MPVRLLFFILTLWVNFSFAQMKITRYSVQSILSDDCKSGFSLDLFDQAEKKDTLNLMILGELTSDLDLKWMIFLDDLYLNKEFKGHERPIMFTITGMNTFARNGIYSFTACPFNACDRAPRS